MQPQLAIQQLVWHVNQRAILKNINFTVAQQEIVAIIGPNGAGKTSLIRCICQQIENYSGTISYAGENLRKLTRAHLAQKIAVVAQINAPIFQLSVYEVVRMGLIPHKGYFTRDTKADHQRVMSALEKTDLLSLAKHDFAQLSGGEQQRTLIARAVVQQAELLILDEPTNHLDVYYQHQILSLICSLGLTVLMTIHDINLATQYCQRLVILKAGQLVADGQPAEIMTTKLLSSIFQMPCQFEAPHAEQAIARIYFHRDQL